MNDDYVAQRRAYVSEIRNSFGNSGTKSADSLSRLGFAERTDAEEALSVGAFVMFKVKFLLCLFFFVAFVVCDRTGTKIFRMSPDTIYEKVSQNYDYTNLEKYVMMVSDFDKNK